MKTILFSAIAMALFFGFYWLTLRRSNLFRLRRFYLVGTLALSLVLPFVSLEMPSRVTAVAQPYTQHFGMTQEPAVVQVDVAGETKTEAVESTADMTNMTTETRGTTETAKTFSFKDIIWYGYVLGCGVAFILLVVKLFKTGRYYRRSVLSDELSTGDMCVRVLGKPDGNLPFSFLRSVFVNPEVFTESELQQVLRHERTHIRQRHTLDLLFTEAVRVLQWFNPVIYLYARELSSVHEYLADEAVLSCGTSRRDYLGLLYKQLCVGKFVPVGNSFRHLLTKKRILMMNQPVKRRVSAWWLLALVPIIAGLLLVNCHPKTEMVAEEEAVEEVIDEPVCMDPDTMPQFPGGIQQYVNNLIGSMKYPELAKKYKLSGVLSVCFIVEKDGRVLFTELDTAHVKWDDVCGEKGEMVLLAPFNGRKGNDGLAVAHLDLGEDAPEDKESRKEIVRQIMDDNMAEINRAFRAAPACKPAMKDGQPVRCMLRLPVGFTTEEHAVNKLVMFQDIAVSPTAKPSKDRYVTGIVALDEQLGPDFIDIPWVGYTSAE
ncbi:MAG: M56 family metallopeptidase [Bacteroidales bacterium]|nr:M56 family metallopeptidase [Bacteroidales bacterium]